MNDIADFGFGTQIRKSPYFDATVRWGATGFSVYNHMYIPRDFGDPEQNFWNLVNDAILCDVAVERQVEITGPDAARFTQLLTCRDLSTMQVGQCKYILITNAALFANLTMKPFMEIDEAEWDEVITYQVDQPQMGALIAWEQSMQGLTKDGFKLRMRG